MNQICGFFLCTKDAFTLAVQYETEHGSPKTLKGNVKAVTRTGERTCTHVGDDSGDDLDVSENEPAV